MANKGLNKQQLQEAVDAFHKSGSKVKASTLLGIPQATYNHRYNEALKAGISPTIKSVVKDSPVDALDQLADAREKIRTLESTINADAKEKFDADFIKRVIIKLKDAPLNPPKWLLKKDKKKSFAGVPTLFASDWHWGEVVDPNQINSVNKYNIAIAQDRAKVMIEKTVDLLRNHVAHTDYPGIVFVLGGDMVSGDIHEELMATNEKEIMPTVIDLFGVLTWCIATLADEFGNVFVPCVSGNHGRNTQKIRAKGRNFTSFDWLLYQFLAKRFESDKRVQFHIPDGSDAYYSIYGHKYLLTHGDQFRGGDGVIGALGPIIRGDHRKRSRNAQIDMEYDTMLLGHWHQLIQLERLIVNGSLKGYDEYAYANNFGYEPPRQALWLTHPEHGITFSIPIYVDSRPKQKIQNWISWK
tara:strand:- start:155 stop:1390 length:1236 start_codon:yes stop_codon:yes gene_type:complete